MTDQNAAILSEIYRYPVKGLTPERMSSAILTANETLARDRAYAIENGNGRFDAAAPKHLPKINFLMLMRNAKLAALQTHFDDTTDQLTIQRDGQVVAQGALNTPAGRAVIAQFLSAYFADELRGAPHIVSATGHSFSDVAEKCVHIVNRASLREVERLVETPLNPLRFRPNLVMDSDVPWQEFDWLGKTLRIGTAELTVFKRTQRCAAVNVNPDTGARDLDIPVHLSRNWGHTDFGVYALVSQGGEISPGAEVKVVG